MSDGGKEGKRAGLVELQGKWHLNKDMKEARAQQSRFGFVLWRAGGVGR